MQGYLHECIFPGSRCWTGDVALDHRQPRRLHHDHRQKGRQRAETGTRSSGEVVRGGAIARGHRTTHGHQPMVTAPRAGHRTGGQIHIHGGHDGIRRAG